MIGLISLFSGQEECAAAWVRWIMSVLWVFSTSLDPVNEEDKKDSDAFFSAVVGASADRLLTGSMEMVGRIVCFQDFFPAGRGEIEWSKESVWEMGGYCLALGMWLARMEC